MKKVYLLGLSLISILALSSSAYAFAYGHIDIKSKLAEPFKATIEVYLDGGENLNLFDVSAASLREYSNLKPETHRYPFISNLHFTKVEKYGHKYIEISGITINSPMFDLIVKVQMKNNTIHFRKYKVFLDPR